MREIEFEVWDKWEEKWVDSERWHIVFYSSWFHLKDVNNNEILGKDVELIQFTGRRDRNKVKIYDQNFIEFKDYHIKQTQIGKVFWANDLGQWLVKSYLWKHSGSFRFEDIKFETVEVIGSALTHKLMNGNKCVIPRESIKEAKK